MNKFRKIVPNILEKKRNRLIMLINMVDSLKEGNDDRNENQGHKNEQKYGDIFSDNIAVQNIGKARGKTKPTKEKISLLRGIRDFFSLFKEPRKSGKKRRFF
jgi:hypothetical protein